MSRINIKKTVSLVLAFLIVFISSVGMCVTANAAVEPLVVPTASNVTSYVGSDVKVEFQLFHEYYNEQLFIDVYDSKGNVVASSTDYFDESDSDEQVFVFTWFAKSFAAGNYTLLATFSYYTGGEWVLASRDAEVAITLKSIPAPKTTTVPAPKIKNVKNTKGKKITAKWSKVKNASKYQVKIGSKTYTSKKTKLTVKKFKKGKTYKVKVRAYSNGKWSKWSKTKKVKVLR